MVKLLQAAALCMIALGFWIVFSAPGVVDLLAAGLLAALGLVIAALASILYELQRERRS